MLRLTENATTVIHALIDESELRDGAGLRISTSGTPPEGLTVAPAEEPREDDVVVEERGARLFVESDVATMLDDKVVDATVDERGGVEFLVAAQ